MKERFLVWWDDDYDREDFIVDLTVMERAYIMNNLDALCDDGVIADWGMHCVEKSTISADQLSNLIDDIAKAQG